VSPLPDHSVEIRGASEPGIDYAWRGNGTLRFLQLRKWAAQSDSTKLPMQARGARLHRRIRWASSLRPQGHLFPYREVGPRATADSSVRSQGGGRSRLQTEVLGPELLRRDSWKQSVRDCVPERTNVKLISGLSFGYVSEELLSCFPLCSVPTIQPISLKPDRWTAVIAVTKGGRQVRVSRNSHARRRGPPSCSDPHL
jgi:hypothetical protein